MNELKELTIEQLKVYKQYLIGEIKKLQLATREIDKEVKARLKCLNG